MPRIQEENQPKAKKKAQGQFSEERIKWSEFRERWKDCEACILCETRSRIVLARGKVPCDILFIGEAPGISEDTLGQPFVGPAGHLLDEMISEALKSIHGEATGINSANLRVAFTNVVCCLPIGEDGKKSIEPLAEHAKACSPRLVEFVERVAQPSLIILVGKYAAKYYKKFFPKESGIKTAEVVHPAAILRSDVGQQGLLVQRNTLTIRDAFEMVLEGKC